MIKLIQIKNYSLIEDSSIELDSKFNVITGETGAGKSLFLSAISLILGEKVDTKLIKNKDKETSILIEIIPTGHKKLVDFLKENNLDSDSLILKRTFSGTSSRNFINNQLVSLQTVKDLTKDLFFIASQNESSQITDKQKQYSVLDGFSEKESQKYFEQFQNSYKEYKELLSLLEETKDKAKHKDFNLDFLEFQLNEIKETSISKDDSLILEKIQDLKKKEEVNDVLKDIIPLIKGEESIIGKIRDLNFYLDKLERKRISINEKNILDEAKLLIEDFIFKNKSNLSEPSDEEDISSLTERYEFLSKILRKHGPTIDDVLNKEKDLEDKILKAKNIDDEILSIEKRINLKKQECLEKAVKLKKIRSKTIPLIEKKITDELQELNMKGSEFRISIEDQPLNQYGIDKIDFLIKPHKGQEPLPISKIASGGELSRILLAINSISKTNGCFLFDEIDSGIGGNTGLKVGEKLRKMGKENQIICISHLHQVAVYSDKHFKIEKTQLRDKTVTSIFELNSDETEKEISRMLGDDLSKNSISHAKELIKNAKKN